MAGETQVLQPISPSKGPAPAADPIPAFKTLEFGGDETNEDPYATLKRLQRHLEYINLQEEYIKDEQRSLKRELVRAQEEIKRIQSVPLVIGQFMEAIDQTYVLPFDTSTSRALHLRPNTINLSSTGIVQSSTGSNYVVRVLSTLDREQLKPNSSVALHRHSNALVDILPPEADSSIAMLGRDEKPDVSYADVGGLDMQKQEIREAVELPLTHFELYKQIGKFLPPCCLSIQGLSFNLLRSRYRPAPWCPPLWPSRYWQDHACQGRSKQHNRQLHPRRRLRVRTEVPW
ncbi:26S proteasome regulatory subunit 6B [Ascosphaera atra]|nr:26S proteasome regulatory subunit 6B [Ascosphaera atra]